MGSEGGPNTNSNNSININIGVGKSVIHLSSFAVVAMVAWHCILTLVSNDLLLELDLRDCHSELQLFIRSLFLICHISPECGWWWALLTKSHSTAIWVGLSPDVLKQILSPPTMNYDIRMSPCRLTKNQVRFVVERVLKSNYEGHLQKDVEVLPQEWNC